MTTITVSGTIKASKKMIPEHINVLSSIIDDTMVELVDFKTKKHFFNESLYFTVKGKEHNILTFGKILDQYMISLGH